MAEPDSKSGHMLGPTLARLSFYVSPEQMGDFEAIYQEKLVPVLKSCGLMESSRQGRATPDGIFSRLFELKTPSEVVEKEQALGDDPAWHEVCRDLGAAFRTADPDGLIQHSLTLYATPAGPGKAVQVGPGEVSRGPGRGQWRTYSMMDGHPRGGESAIFQDREGYLWFGSRRDGVSRYDGQRVKTFTTEDGLAGNEVQAIFQDRDGYLWFGTGGIWSGAAVGGASRYDGQRFITFTAEDGLASNKVQSIFQDRDGYLWFGTRQGVSRYDGQDFTSFTVEHGLADNWVSSILQDREGCLWFGTHGGVSRYDGKNWTTFTARDGLAHNEVSSAFLDREEVFWFGTRGGVSRYDGQRFTTFSSKDGLADNRVSSILQDREGHLWFSTVNRGVSRYDGHCFTTFTTEDGLAHNVVQSILQDREGHFWFSNTAGVSRYDAKTFTIFEDELPHRSVRLVFQDRKGDLWFGTLNRGVSRYDGQTFTTFTTEDGLAHNEVRAIFQDREENLWFGTQHGVSRYDGQTFTTFSSEDGLTPSLVRAIFQDREGYLWFGGAGVSRYDGRCFTTFTTEDGLAHNGIWSILQDQEGYLWFTTNRGVSRYDGVTFTTFTIEDGLPFHIVRSILQDREGRLWFGTENGLSVYDGQTWTTFTTADGLNYNHINSIFQDRQGGLWFAHWLGGVSRYDGQVFQGLTQEDGLADNGVRDVFEDLEGNIWFATHGGLTRYRPTIPEPPRVAIDAVVADRRYEGVSEVSLSSSAGLTAFEFRGMSFKTRRDGMVYRYRLVGCDQGWQTTRARRVEYEDLPLGTYTFEVQAVDRDLVYSKVPATVRLAVVPDAQVQALTEALSQGGAPGEFVGDGKAVRQVQVQLAEVARTDVTVLILGETGTGKGLAARAVHGLSERRAGPFVQINCGAMPEGLIESELFGHERGAFTGALSRKLGKVEISRGGTLFLDEIGDLAPEAQVKLLRLLEERTFERVGGAETLLADVRIVAATNRDLKQMVADRTFREDLYFRLNTFPVRMPPLRERQADIPHLAAHFVKQMAAHLNKEIPRLPSEALAVLRAYDWPGNVRELEHAIQHAVIVCRGSEVRVRDIVLDFEGVDSTEEVVTLEEHERRYIQSVLEKTGWVIKGPHGAAALLRMPESTLRYRIKRLGIRRE